MVTVLKPFYILDVVPIIFIIKTSNKLRLIISRTTQNLITQDVTLLAFCSGSFYPKTSSASCD